MQKVVGSNPIIRFFKSSTFSSTSDLVGRFGGALGGLGQRQGAEHAGPWPERRSRDEGGDAVAKYR